MLTHADVLAACGYAVAIMLVIGLIFLMMLHKAPAPKRDDPKPDDPRHPADR
jgi:hypothetical protein